MPPHEPLSAVDAAWLRMDGATNPMTVSTLLLFDGEMTRERFLELVRERVLRHRRFRQRVVVPRRPFARARWIDDVDFRLGDHVSEVQLPAPGDDASMQRVIGELLGRSLDRDKPLWHAHVFCGRQGGGAVLVRIHHCVGDGVALVRMLLSIVDEGSALPPADVGMTPNAPTRIADVAREVWARAKALGRIVVLPNDPHTALRGKLDGRKVGAWSKAIDLEEVRRAAHRRGAKLNDLLVSALTGAIGAHLRAHERPPRRDPHAMIPIFLRGGADDGNHFGLVFLALPIAVVDPEARLRVVRQRMDAIKATPEAVVAMDVLALFGAAPYAIERLGVEIFSRKASVMITDVPGPPMPIHLDGARVRAMILWAPVSGRLGVSLGLLSHAGEVRLGVCVDVARDIDPYAVVARFEDEIDALTAPPPAREARDDRDDRDDRDRDRDRDRERAEIRATGGVPR